jgi:DNA-binding CsgD family transcriptional regulator
LQRGDSLGRVLARDERDDSGRGSGAAQVSARIADDHDHLRVKYAAQPHRFHWALGTENVVAVAGEDASELGVATVPHEEHTHLGEICGGRVFHLASQHARPTSEERQSRISVPYERTYDRAAMRRGDWGTEELLERDTEFHALSWLLDGALSGRGSVVLVEGPAGMGKSRLLDAWMAHARNQSVDVLHARGDELVMDSSFATVRELFWSRLGEAGAAEFVGAARLATPVFEGQRESDGEPEPVGAVLHGLYWLVAGLAERAPLALIVDDAHLLDPASGRFLIYLARRIDSLPVLLVVASRPGDPVRLAELSELAARVLPLAPLSVEASATLVRRTLGPRADEALCRSCHEATHGNPFYLRELAGALRTEGERPSVQLAERVRALGIGAIAANVLLRLARLGPDCERLAQALAILGPGSALRHAAALASLDRRPAGSAADAMRAADLISDAATLSFVHPIVNETIASQLPAGRRAELHGVAARLLASDGAPSDRVAAHLLSAEPFGEVWAVQALRAAARDALARGAPEAASSYLRRALSEPPPPQARLDTLLELGHAEAMLPVAQEYPALREALALATDPAQRAEIALELALALFGVLRNSDARVVLDDALRYEQDLDPAMIERLEQALIGGGMDDLAAAPDIQARAERHFERARRGEVRDPRMLAALAAVAGFTARSAAEATELAQQALRDERLLSRWLDDGYVTASWILCMMDRLAEAAAAADRGLVEAQRRGSAPMYLQLALLRADIALRAGDLGAAQEFSERARELGRELGAELFGTVFLALVALERGRVDDAAAMVESVELPETGLNAATLMAMRGVVRVTAGDHGPGLSDLLDADGRIRGAGQRLSVGTSWVPSAVAALLALGRREEAVEIANRELAEAVAFGAAHLHGVALSVCGSLETGPAALTRLREAVAILELSEARLDYARGLVELGARLRQEGEREPARRELSRALDIASGCGAVTLAERARSELTATGARPRRERLTGPAALTPAELRTAQMAADGLTNREIAQALFVSTKTVETQLSAAYAKLAIGSRRELRSALARVAER